MISIASATSTMLLLPTLINAHGPLNAPALFNASGVAAANAVIVHIPVISTGIAWIDRQLISLANLPSDWDGYGSSSPNIENLNALARILREHSPANLSPGSIVPAADGSLQVEWHLRDMSFGLLIEEGQTITSWLQDHTEYDEIEKHGLEAIQLFRFAALSSLIM